ncbi:MAG: hypothetical protein IJJ63_01820 [Bacilli bacterium]|nr:hypothetical protein [Bacilli bacterium]
MYDQYLIPANTKRGKLLLGWFRPFDLALVTTGILITMILLAFMPLSSTFVTILILAPGLISAFLVMPLPYYHNMLTVIVELYEFLTERQTYRWKGWCYKSGEGKEK